MTSLTTTQIQLASALVAGLLAVAPSLDVLLDQHWPMAVAPVLAYGRAGTETLNHHRTERKDR